MVESPCQFCKERKIPKTCEQHCDRWKQYVAEKEKDDKLVYEKKHLAYRIYGYDVHRNPKSF